MTNTKQLLADTLIKMLRTHTLDKITVTDLVSECNISRQSFYYYFKDIYDVVEWIFSQEAEKALKEYSDLETWTIGYVLLMRWSRKNRVLVMHTYQSVRKEVVEQFVEKVIFGYLLHLVRQQAEGMQVTKEQCDFIAHFFTLSLRAVFLDWISKGMQEEPERMAEQVNTVIQGDFKKALLHFEQKNQKK